MGSNIRERKFGAGFSRVGLAALAFALAFGGAALVETRADAADAPAVPADVDPAVLDHGRELFADWSCGTCHVLKDAEGTGHIGPALDGTKLTKAFVSGRIANGQGQMPSFAGLLTDEEIDDLATYIAIESNK